MTTPAPAAKSADPRWEWVRYWHGEHRHDQARALEAAIERAHATALKTPESSQ